MAGGIGVCGRGHFQGGKVKEKDSSTSQTGESRRDKSERW